MTDSASPITLTLTWNAQQKQGALHIRNESDNGLRWIMGLWNPLGWEIHDAFHRTVPPDAVPRAQLRAPLETDYAILLPRTEMTRDFKATRTGADYTISFLGAKYSHLKPGTYTVKAIWGLTLCHWAPQPGVDLPALPASVESAPLTIWLP